MFQLFKVETKFMTRKWIEVNDLLDSKYSVDQNRRFKNPMLRSDLCDDAYIVVKGGINVEGNASNNLVNRFFLVFQNNAPFRSCISIILWHQRDSRTFIKMK